MCQPMSRLSTFAIVFPELEIDLFVNVKQNQRLSALTTYAFFLLEFAAIVVVAEVHL